jgi:GT2 family glycosyltransferase
MARTLPLSVVIPTHNRRVMVTETLESLRGQSLPVDDFEVVVVCDGDIDGTQAALLKLEMPFPLQVLAQPQAGQAAARNRGAAAAKGAVLLFLDDDVLAVPELLAEHLHSHTGRPDRVVVGRLLPDPSVPPRGWTRWEQRWFDRRYEELAGGLTPVNGRKFYSGNASVSRAAFLAVGGFDTRLPRAEDVELGNRLQRWGAELGFNGRAACVHRGVHSFSGWSRIQYLYGRCDVQLAALPEGATNVPLATWFQSRNALNRLLCRLGVGRPRLAAALLSALRLAGAATDAARLYPLALMCYSAIANLRYWQGAADELGGAGSLWQVLATPRGEAVTA